MAVGLPAKTTYANGDVFSASDINDTNGTINLIGQTNNFYAGKNRLINSDYSIWQRGTSFTGFSIYTADRWFHTYDNNPTSATVSRQAFTPGTAPVAGYEGQYFLRMGVTTAGTATGQFLYQRVEDVRTLAGQSVTYSFWAKADSARTVGVYSYQNFGSGGSADVSGSTTNFSVTTAWQRFSMSVTMGSMTGKTIGANSFMGFVMTMPAANGVAIDFWGAQLEAGSAVTAFETASGSIQGELALCQRYYYRIGGEQTFQAMALGWGNGSAGAYIHITTPVSMRVAPTALDYSTLVIGDLINNNQAVTVLLLTGNYGGSKVQTLSATVSSGLTVNRPYGLYANNSTSAFVGLSAEL
jgi:hypothetical protein